ncbi:predicted protein [Postia placenta Mad-698-R]|nr:predicted protein [Postia placenta Mad-698-R]
MIFIPLLFSYLVFMTNVFIAYDHAARTFGYPSLGGPLKYLQLSGIAIRPTPWLPAVRVDIKTHSAMQWEVYEEYFNSSISYVLPSTVSLDELTCPLREPFADDNNGNDGYSDGDEWCYALPESSFFDQFFFFHDQSVSAMCAVTDAPVEEPSTTPSTDVADKPASDALPSPMDATSKTSSPFEETIEWLTPYLPAVALLIMMEGFLQICSRTERSADHLCTAKDRKDKQKDLSDISSSIESVAVNVRSRNKRKNRKKKKKKKTFAVVEIPTSQRATRADLLLRPDDVKRMWDWIPSRFCQPSRY